MVGDSSSPIAQLVARRLDDLIDEVNGKAAEFEAGRLRLQMVWVEPEVVAPDEDAEGGEG